VLFPGDPGVPQYGLLANYKNFSPRAGFAYDLTGDGRTCLPGGFGLFYDALQNGIYNNRFVDVTPFSTQVNLTAPKGPFSNPYLGIVNPFPAPYPPPANTPFPAPVQVMTYDSANGGVYKTPVSTNYNLTGGVFRQPGESQRRAVVAAIRQRRPRLPGRQLELQLAPVDRATAAFQRLHVPGELHLSKSPDDVPYGSSPTTVGVSAAGGSSYKSPIPWYMPGRHQFDYGPSEFDHQHRLVTSFVWRLPLLGHSSRLLRYVTSGWQLTGLFIAQSGGPMTAIAGKDQSGTALATDRAYYVGGVDP
jgi:hypothetical protein